MVNEIETNVCKKKKRKRERFFACRCSHLRKRDHILDNCERALGKYRFDYPFDRSFYPLFSFFFFFFTNAYVKIQCMISLRCSCNPLRIYRFHTYRWTRCILRFLPSLHFFFSSLVASRVFSLLVSLQLRYFVAIYYLEQRGNTNKIHTRRIK